MEFKDFCLQLHSQAGCTKAECDTGTFTDFLSSFLDKSEKTVKEGAEFCTSYCKMFEKTFKINHTALTCYNY